MGSLGEGVMGIMGEGRHQQQELEKHQEITVRGARRAAAQLEQSITPCLASSSMSQLQGGPGPQESPLNKSYSTICQSSVAILAGTAEPHFLPEEVSRGAMGLGKQDRGGLGFAEEKLRKG